MEFSGRKFVVSGGAGFIGSHLVDALLAREAVVVVLDDLSSGFAKNLEDAKGQLEFVEASILDASAVARAVEGAAGVFHLAAVASVVESIENPIRAHAVNATGTLQILEAARQSKKPPKVVFSSSAAVYGNEPTIPKIETLSPGPATPYATQKLLGELYLSNYHHLHGVHGVSLRYFNVFGPRQDPHSMYSGVVSAFCDRISRGNEITINGDGTTTRDFVYVADVVQANIKAMGSDIADGRPINIGTGKTTSLLELARQIHTVCGREERISFGPERPGDVRHSSANINAATSLIGYKPECDLGSGLRALLAGSI